jgi:alanine dehydrogenase
MRVGVVTEIKPAERRVALTPAGADALVRSGHEVLVQAGAGAGSGYTDAMYAAAGAQVAPRAEDVWEASELLVKVKEPVASEYGLLQAGLALFTYLHLAADPPLVEALVRSGCTAIAYETVKDSGGGLPLLAPMSEIAGRLAAQAGAYFLQDPLGGRGVLIGGSPGVAPARVVVIGGGVVGTSAARVASGMGAEVTILERDPQRLRELEHDFSGRARVLMSDAMTLEAEVSAADVIVCAVLVTGAAAPKLIGRPMLARLRPRAVIVDVAIDQGGCCETSRPTTHAEPTFVVDEVLHYCVANMPGAVPATSTRALTNVTLPYVQRLADRSVDAALAEDAGLAAGLNVRAGEIRLPALAAA